MGRGRMKERPYLQLMVGMCFLSFIVTCGGGDSGSFSGGASQTTGGGTSPPTTGGTAALTKQFGSSRLDGAVSAAVDGGGNVYVAGNTWGTVVPSSPNPDATAATSDIFIAKYDRSGTLQWIRQLGTVQDDSVTGIAIDNTGNVIVAGFTFGSLFSANRGGSDHFVMKLEPATGDAIWEIQDGGNDLEEAWGVSVDRNGNIYLAGGSRGDLSGSGNSGDFDAFLISYTGDGNMRWVSLAVAAINGTDFDMARAVTVDEDRGFVYAAGEGFAPKFLSDNTTLVDDADIFVVRTDMATGAGLSGVFFYGIISNDDTPMSSFATGIALNRFGDAFVSGYTIERNKEFHSNAGDVTFELFKLDRSEDMHLLWHSYKPAGPHPGNKALGIAVDSMQDVYLTGYVSIQLDPDGDPHLGGTDAFLMQFDGNSGATLWTRQFGTAGSDRGFGMAIDRNRVGDVHYVVGETFGSMDGNSNLGGYDAFSAQFDQFGNRL